MDNGAHKDINDNGTMVKVPDGWVFNQWFEDNNNTTHFTSVFIPEKVWPIIK